MATTLFQLPTPDGPCTVELALPPDGKPAPAVIVFYDAAGLRPAQTQIAERIAADGYVVFQPDLFHRAPPLDNLLGEKPTLGAIMKVFGDIKLRPKFMADYYGPALDYGNLETTIGALLDHIGTHKAVHGGVGLTGYCMGGNASFRTATIFGSRIAASASFHPGGLVTAAPDSPHTRASHIKARVYLAPATGDLPAESEAKLRTELDAGGVRYEIEHYAAQHGYAVPDAGDRFNAAAAERHYAALSRLYRETLRG